MSTLSRVLKLIATGTVSLLLTSCYGTVQAMYGVPFRLREVTIKTQTADTPARPIPGLRVSLSGTGSFMEAQTDLHGEAVFSADPDLDLTISVEDTDGSANLGEFSGTTAPLPRTGGNFTYPVTMTPR